MVLRLWNVAAVADNSGAREVLARWQRPIRLHTTERLDGARREAWTHGEWARRRWPGPWRHGRARVVSRRDLSFLAVEPRLVGGG